MGDFDTAASTGDNSCEIPSVSLDSITVAEFVRDYYSVGQPVRLTAGGDVNAGQPGVDHVANLFPEFASLDIFLEKHGHLVAAGGEIPYGENFGNKNHQSRPLKEFVNPENQDSSESRARIAFDSGLVSQHPELQVLQNAAPAFASELCDQRSTAGMQLSLGPEGSGAPLHGHSAAWNMLLFGRKRWILSAPGEGNSLGIARFGLATTTTSRSEHIRDWLANLRTRFIIN